jgi:hypothetical protein
MRSPRIFRWLSTLRFSALVPLAALPLPGCADSKREPPAATGGSTSMPPGVDRHDSVVELRLDGTPEVLSGGARLEVRELYPVVNLVVTTVFESNHDDLLQIQLAFDGVENAVGAHRSEFGGLSNSAAVAVAYLERISYSSQSGSLDVTLTGDGAIQGRFDAELAVDVQGSSDPDGIPASAKNFSIAGTFEGTWSLFCRSPVVGLPGDHSVTDSPYCNNLEF